MMKPRLLLCVSISGLVSAVCVLMSVTGVLMTLAAGVASLAVLSRETESDESMASEWPFWLVCTFSFLAMTLMLAPLAALPAVSLALCLFSPLLGGMIYAIERAFSTWRRRRTQPYVNRERSEDCEF